MLSLSLLRPLPCCVPPGWRPVLISILYVVVMLLVADTLKVVVLRLVKRHSQVKVRSLNCTSESAGAV